MLAWNIGLTAQRLLSSLGTLLLIICCLYCLLMVQMSMWQRACSAQMKKLGNFLEHSGIIKENSTDKFWTEQVSLEASRLAGRSCC